MERLIEALRSYEQADEDGVMVIVSRQACDEAANEIERLRLQNRSFAKAIVEGDEPFGGKEWEALLQAAEATNKHSD